MGSGRVGSLRKLVSLAIIFGLSTMLDIGRFRRTSAQEATVGLFFSRSFSTNQCYASLLVVSQLSPNIV